MSAEPMPQPEPDAPQPRLKLAEDCAAREHELVLNKNGQQYVFRCAYGKEHDLLLRLADEVRNPNTDLDWFDAAVLSHQMGVKLKERLDERNHGPRRPTPRP